MVFTATSYTASEGHHNPVNLKQKDTPMIPTAFERITAKLAEMGLASSPGSEPGSIRSQCPAHASKTARSRPLAVKPSDGRALIHCFGGCTPHDVMDALGMDMGDLFDEGKGRTYTYPDGRIVKRTGTGKGKNIWQSGNRKGNALYRGDELTAATTVFVTEGEQDADTIRYLGAQAVCSAMGAKNADKADWLAVQGLDVIIVAHKDEDGKTYARAVEECVTKAGAASVRIVEAKVGNDATDHVAADWGLEDFVDAPWWTLSGAKAESDREGTQTAVPRLWKAKKLKPATQPKFLAKNRIPKSAITILIGEEGIGKSLLWVLFAAAVTTGKPLPEFGIPATEPADIILILTEDEWSSTVLPRLKVAGADLDRVHVICTEDDGSGSPVFPDDMHLITQADITPAMVVCDAWLDTVPFKIRRR